MASDADAHKADERVRRMLLSADASGVSGVGRGILMMPRQGTSGIGADCALCHLSENPDQKIIFGNDSVFFLQNAQEQGALLGSGVIIPVRHAETVFDLTPGELCATFALLHQVKSWMDDRYHPDGYNVGWNCGAVGGQKDMHAHMHVIPRFRQELYAGCGIRHWLKRPENRWW